MKIMQWILVLVITFAAGWANAADFGPYPYTTNDPNVVVSNPRIGESRPPPSYGEVDIYLNVGGTGSLLYYGTESFTYNFSSSGLDYYTSAPTVICAGTTPQKCALVTVRFTYHSVVANRMRHYVYTIIGGSAVPQ